MGEIERLDRVMGVNIAAGGAYLALVDRPLVAVMATDTPKIELSTNVDELTALHRFGERLVVEASRLRVQRVAFAKPRPCQWSYSNAYTRVSLQVAGSLALHQANIGVVE